MPLISPNNVTNKKNKGLFTLALLLLVLGGVALYKGSHDNAIRSLGALACVASAYLVRKSKRQSSTASIGTTDQRADQKLANRPGRLMWSLGAVSLLLIGLSYLLLSSDAAHGHHEIWPVYLFAGVMVVCGLFLSYLVARML
jgi:hypothetical protein